MIHTLWNLSRSIPWKAEQLLPGHVVYYLSDYWPCEVDVNENYWQLQYERGGTLNWRRYLANRVLHRLKIEKAQYQLDFDHVIFVSHAVQNYIIKAGYSWAVNGSVIYNGVDIGQFSPAESVPNSVDGYLLFVGSLSPHKGLQTVIDAIALLTNNSDFPKVTLRVAGSGHETHIRDIKSKINALGLNNRVNLMERLERSKMPELYRHARALVFPSIWQEPLARTTQEAMACGVPVIATLTGGTAELVENRING